MYDIEMVEIESRQKALSRMAEDFERCLSYPRDLQGVPTPHLEEVFKRVKADLDEARQAKMQPNPWAAARAPLTEAEALMGFFRDMMEQRRTGPWAEQLLYADLILQQSFELLRARARRAGLIHEKDPVFHHLPPLTCLDVSRTPTAFPSRSRILPAGPDAPSGGGGGSQEPEGGRGLREPRESPRRGILQLTELPFSLVQLPHRYLEQPNLLATLAHEAFHVVDTGGILTSWITSHVVVPHQLGSATANWSEWRREILADLFGLALGGAAYAHVLAHICVPLHHSKVRDTHPGIAVRLKAIEVAAGALEIDIRDLDVLQHVCSHYQRGADPDFMQNIAGEVAALLATPLPTGTLQEILVPPTREESSWSRLPGDVHLTHWNARSPVEDIAEIFLETARRQLSGDDKLLLDWLRFDRERVPSLAPTRLISAGSLKKVPLPAMLAAYDAMDFVAATNGQLYANMVAGFARRGRKWDRIHLYFLTDEALRMMVTRERTHAKLKAEKRTAMEQLENGLRTSGWTDSWEIREYDSPTLFASFWWIGDQLDRVHTSGRVWGRDVQFSPGTDYRWLPGAKNMEIDELHRGLEGGLRVESTLLASSHPPAATG
ncbi:MAG: hypothetical protein ABIO70_05780 [Pseudomonadota bacterium]